MARKKLISSDEATPAKGQHKSPCSDCPFRRDALKGWLGSMSVGEWIQAAHGETRMDCHVHIGAQCAGAAIYRRNTCKRVEAPNLVLEKNHEKVFSNLMQFREHHESRPGKKELEAAVDEVFTLEDDDAETHA